MSASCTSRVRFEVSTTTGGVAALIVPSSGMLTWFVERTSSRNASNSSSARSTSSTRSTAGLSRSARSTGRASRKRSSNSDCSAASGSTAWRRRPRGRAGAGSGGGSPSRRAPGRRRCPRSTAAGPAAGRAPRRTPRRARSCRCRARPRAAAAAAWPGRGSRSSPGSRRTGSRCGPGARRAAGGSRPSPGACDSCPHCALYAQVPPPSRRRCSERPRRVGADAAGGGRRSGLRGRPELALHLRRVGTGLRCICAGSGSEVGGGVHVAAGGEVGAVARGGVLLSQVVAGPLVADSRPSHARPMVAAEEDGVAGA